MDGEAPCETVITVGSVSTVSCDGPEEKKKSEEEDEAAAIVDPEAAKEAFVVIDIKCDGGKRSDGDGDGQSEKMCRICHLSPDQQQSEGSDLIQLGCGCKDELGVSHRQCAEAWFKLKGDRMCEICGKCAKNVTGIDDANFMEEWNERRIILANSSNSSSERESCWRCQPFCNLLMACLVIGIILPWFFRASLF